MVRWGGYSEMWGRKFWRFKKSPNRKGGIISNIGISFLNKEVWQNWRGCWQIWWKVRSIRRISNGISSKSIGSGVGIGSGIIPQLPGSIWQIGEERWWRRYRSVGTSYNLSYFSLERFGGVRVLISVQVQHSINISYILPYKWGGGGGSPVVAQAEAKMEADTNGEEVQLR